MLDLRRCFNFHRPQRNTGFGSAEIGKVPDSKEAIHLLNGLVTLTNSKVESSSFWGDHGTGQEHTFLFFFNLLVYVFGCSRSPVAHMIFSLHCSMWDLVPPGLESNLGSLHWGMASEPLDRQRSPKSTSF